jgi:exodeoxyribonuclease-3
VKLATWNLNSIRARQSRLYAWLDAEKPDVVCLQETKIEDEDFPRDGLRAAGYHSACFGQRSYNGVAILARAPIEDVARGLGDDPADDEARVIAATVGDVRVISVYVPNGQDLASDKFPYKLAWFARLRRYLERTASPTRKVVVCGDMNVTADDRDVWSPEKWAGHIHCTPEERTAFADMIAWGLVDLFRAAHPDGGVYSWWDYRGVSFFKNQGLRIDYVLGTQALASRVASCTIDRTARKGQDASDHAPVVATFAD